MIAGRSNHVQVGRYILKSEGLNAVFVQKLLLF